MSIAIARNTENTVGRSASILALLLCAVSMPASAHVTTEGLRHTLTEDNCPPGAYGWELNGDSEYVKDGDPEGIPQEFDRTLPTASLFCPECLKDPRYAADVPYATHVVVADYPCSDLCPNYTVQVIYLRLAPGDSCDSLGGVMQEESIPQGISTVSKPFCVPKVIARKR